MAETTSFKGHELVSMEEHGKEWTSCKKCSVILPPLSLLYTSVEADFTQCPEPTPEAATGESEARRNCGCATSCAGCPESGAIEIARRSVQAQLPEDYTGEVHHWVYRTIIQSALRGSPGVPPSTPEEVQQAEHWLAIQDANGLSDTGNAEAVRGLLSLIEEMAGSPGSGEPVAWVSEKGFNKLLAVGGLAVVSGKMVPEGVTDVDPRIVPLYATSRTAVEPEPHHEICGRCDWRAEAEQKLLQAGQAIGELADQAGYSRTAVEPEHLPNALANRVTAMLGSWLRKGEGVDSEDIHEVMRKEFTAVLERCRPAVAKSDPMPTKCRLGRLPCENPHMTPPCNCYDEPAATDTEQEE